MLFLNNHNQSVGINVPKEAQKIGYGKWSSKAEAHCSCKMNLSRTF